MGTQTKAETVAAHSCKHQKNNQLHVSCPPSHCLTITGPVQLGALISIIISASDRQPCVCFCARECECVINRPNTQSECSRGQDERAL